jgi:ABC-type Fe3+-hydroxamate transport system substrate-binding protein
VILARRAAALCAAAAVALALAVATAALPEPVPEPVPEAAPARRIVTLAPHLAELVHAAGAGAQLVGVSDWSDYPAGVESLPRVGSAVQVDLETLVALAPDLVLGWEGGNPARLLQQVEGQGFRLVTFGVETLEDIGTQIEAIGRLAGTPGPAAQAAARYHAGLAALRAEQAGKAELRVFYQVSWRPLYTVGGRQVISQVITLCRGRNIFGDQAVLAPAVGLEAIVARDPEVILASARQAAELAEWRRWPEVAAVAGGHLYTVPGDLLARPSPRILDGARAVCAALDQARP